MGQEIKVKALENARSANPAQVQMIAQLEGNEILEDIFAHFAAQKEQGIQYAITVAISGIQSNLLDGGNPFNIPNLPWFAVRIKNDGPNNVLVGINQEVNTSQAPVNGGESTEASFHEPLIKFIRIQCYQSGVASPNASLRIFGTK